MSTPVKVRANRRNALASTGPKTATGKALVARNGVTHGIQSWKPVVAAFENQEVWDQHLAATIADLRPSGHVETILADRVALLFWRMGRVTRFEQEAISTGIEAAEILWARQINPNNPRADSPLPKLKKQIAKLRWELALLQGLLANAGNDDVMHLAAVLVIKRAAKNAEVDLQTLTIQDYPGGGEVDIWDVMWSASLTRNALEAIATAKGWKLAEIVEGLTEDVKDDLRDKQQEMRLMKADLARFRRRLILADESSTERVRRYETGLERAMLRCLHELDRLQSARRGTVRGVGIRVSTKDGSSAEAVALVGGTPAPSNGDHRD